MLFAPLRVVEAPLRAARGPLRLATAPVRVAADLYRRTTGRSRRTWVSDGRAHIEYRPVAEADVAAFAERVVEVLELHADVDHATVIPWVARVVVAFDDAVTTVDDLVRLVVRVEQKFGVADRPFHADRPDHPADGEPVLREAVQLASSMAGIGGSVYGLARRLVPGRGPMDLSWLGTLLANVPQLRGAVEAQLGERTTDLVLGMSNSLLRAVNLGMSGHVVDIAQRVHRLGELAAVRAAWREREPALAAASQVPAASMEPRLERPSPVRDGPIESYAQQSWRLSIGGFAASLLTTEDVERSAAPLLDGIPKAARLGRSVFDTELARVLAARGCLVLEPHALQLLDRVDCVVVEACLLLGPDGRFGHEGNLFVRAAHAAGLDLLAVANDPSDVDHPDLPAVETRLVDRRVARLQDDGAAVLAVGATGAAAFRRADVRVGMQPAGHPPAWDADVVCAGELADALLMVRAVDAARRNSQQAALMTSAGAGIGALTALGGLRRDTGRRVLRVVDAASLLAMGNGMRLARRLGDLPASLRRDEVSWHALPVDEVLARLESSTDGLSDALWEQRHVPPASPSHPVVELGRAAGKELANPITPVLAGGMGLSLVTGSSADAWLVGSVLGLNAVIGGTQRYRADRAVAHLHEAGQQTVTVVRGGAERRVPAQQLVPGDVLRLTPGDPVPADARLLEARGLQADESTLTGESMPVPKQVEPVDAQAVADRASMVHAGTSVSTGWATAVVVAVGDDTQARQALVWTEVADDVVTGVEARLRELTATTIPLAMMSAGGVAAAGLARRVPAAELVDAGVGLAVAAVPEGLPLLASAAQRAAARRLSRHGVLVRNPRAIEALGRVDVLCADKTGTLTRGRIRLDVVSDGVTDVPAGQGNGTHHQVLLAARRATPIDNDVDRLPHPTDQAVAEGTRSIGVRRAGGGTFEILDDLPFEPNRSYHAVLADTEDGRRLSVKGAPEEILRRCIRWTHQDQTRDLDDAAREQLADESERLAAQGMRVLAVAEKRVRRRAVSDDDVDGLDFVGFIGLRDPVRPVSRESVERLKRAGVDVVMITGDHPTTARSIAAELGLADGQMLAGTDIEAMTEDELAEVLPDVTVFARVTPLHKVRIVQALQATGKVVAMTGDGANDAPAIRLADAGIALGSRATSAARDAADVVIVDDRLEVIVDAIAEGRGLWGSVRDAVSVLVGGNLGEIAFTFIGTLLGRRPPLDARQLLLVNLLTDVAPAMALAVRRPSSSVDQLLSEGPEQSLGQELDRALVWRGAGTAAGATAAFGLTRWTGSIQRARTAGLVALVGAQFGQTLATSNRDLRVIGTGLGSFAAMAALVQTPGLSRVVGCRPIGPVAWAAGFTGAAVGTAVGVLGPRLEHAHASESGWSSQVVGRLVAAAPELPAGLIET